MVFNDRPHLNDTSMFSNSKFRGMNMLRERSKTLPGIVTQVYQCMEMFTRFRFTKLTFTIPTTEEM